MISVDLSDLIPHGLLAYPDAIAATIPDIAEAIRTEIVRLAMERLHTTSEDYIQGLQPIAYNLPGGRLPKGEAVVATITLVGWLPNAVEQGWAGGDLRDGLLNGRNAKDGKHGRYAVIPFRHGTPGSSGRNATPMGAAYRPGMRMTEDGVEEYGLASLADARKLGEAVYKRARKLKATTKDPSAPTAWGERLPEGHAPKLLPHHKTDLYAGMVRERKTYGAATQTQYTTFRTISENSDPSAWLHPGIEGHRLFDAGAEYAGRAAGHLLQQALDAVQRGGSR